MVYPQVTGGFPINDDYELGWLVGSTHGYGPTHMMTLFFFPGAIMRPSLPARCGPGSVGKRARNCGTALSTEDCWQQKNCEAAMVKSREVCEFMDNDYPFIVHDYPLLSILD